MGRCAGTWIRAHRKALKFVMDAAGHALPLRQRAPQLRPLRLRFVDETLQMTARSILPSSTRQVSPARSLTHSAEEIVPLHSGVATSVWIAATAGDPMVLMMAALHHSKHERRAGADARSAD